MRNAYRIFVGKLEGKRSVEDRDVDRRMILKLILKKQSGVVLVGFVWCRTGACSRHL
jgi:hypothetical protein